MSMPRSIKDAAVKQCLRAARQSVTRHVQVGARTVAFRTPFPSPVDWRDCWIYFLMLDRFANPDAPPRGPWNQAYGLRQGGTFNGVRAQLDYLADLGVSALWLSPVQQNALPDWPFNYHGYGIQNFLRIDGRFASNGRSDTAEEELRALVDEAHARGIYVILDIVLSHTARVFDYLLDGKTQRLVQDWSIMNAPFNGEPPICWLDKCGRPRRDWTNVLPPPEQLSLDDAVWPSDLQRAEFFRRRGDKLSYDASQGFIRGDFADMRQLVVEYLAGTPEQEPLRQQYGVRPVLEILIECYCYLIAKFDFDGFRIDTAKHVDAGALEIFGNAIREFALSIGKKNFFTFGEVADNEYVIARFIGRTHSAAEDGFGIDAAIDFPLFHTLGAVAKGACDVRELQHVFTVRKEAQAGRISSHGEAGRYFVAFLDNHDQWRRYYDVETDPLQVQLALALLFCLQGIPCIYYGTEQGLRGAVDAAGRADYTSAEAVREALWGKSDAFDRTHHLYREIQLLARLRRAEPALRYGRLYFRRISQNGTDYGYSYGAGGLVAFSRLLADREVLVVANTSPTTPFEGYVLVDADLNRQTRPYRCVHGTCTLPGHTTVVQVPGARLYNHDVVSLTEDSAALHLTLAPMETQIYLSDPDLVAEMLNHPIP